MVITKLWGPFTFVIFTENMLGHGADGVVAQAVLHSDQGSLQAQVMAHVFVTDLVWLTHIGRMSTPALFSRALLHISTFTT